MAGQAEKDLLVEAELERLKQEPSLWAEMQRILIRMVIRSLRIVGGVLMAVVALRLFEIATGVADTPFASLTLGRLFWGVFASLGVLVLGFGAITTAFGAGPGRPSNSESALRAQAAKNVEIQLAERHRVQHEALAEKVKAERWYRHGRWVGMLFDPALFRRHPWAPVVVLIVFYAGLAFMALSQG